MNDAQRRQWLYDYYKNRRASPEWLRVIKKMDDRKVFAIYTRLREKN